MQTAIIADDHDLVRRGLAAVLADIGGVELVAEAANGIEAISLVKQHRPTLLSLDAAMPLARGIEVFAEARRWSPRYKSCRCYRLYFGGLAFRLDGRGRRRAVSEKLRSRRAEGRI